MSTSEVARPHRGWARGKEFVGDVGNTGLRGMMGSIGRQGGRCMRGAVRGPTQSRVVLPMIRLAGPRHVLATRLIRRVR